MQEALAVVRQQSDELPELAAATALAQLCQQQGKRGAGLEQLKPIYFRFSEGLEYPELLKCRHIARPALKAVESRTP